MEDLVVHLPSIASTGTVKPDDEGPPWLTPLKNDTDDDDDDDETCFKCQDLTAWNNNPILMWGQQLILVIEPFT